MVYTEEVYPEDDYRMIDKRLEDEGWGYHGFDMGPAKPVKSNIKKTKAKKHG
jgi:hypothetical protein